MRIGARLPTLTALEAGVVTALLKKQNIDERTLLKETRRFRGVRLKTVRVDLGKVSACLNLRYRPLGFINYVSCSVT
jgi:hypothetical protein